MANISIAIFLYLKCYNIFLDFLSIQKATELLSAETAESDSVALDYGKRLSSFFVGVLVII